MNTKDQLRKDFHAVRRSAHETGGADAARQMTELFLGALRRMGVAEGVTITAYAAISSEISADGLMVALDAAGYVLALPVVTAEGSPLTFRRWRPGDVLIGGDHATRHPGENAPAVMPDVVVAPLLAFDRTGTRLGMGKGYYDRTLALLRKNAPVIAVGLAFAVQEAESLPCDAFDEPLDWVVTEKEVIRSHQRSDRVRRT